MFRQSFFRLVGVSVSVLVLGWQSDNRATGAGDEPMVKVAIKTVELDKLDDDEPLERTITAATGSVLEVALEQQTSRGKIWHLTGHDKRQFEWVFNPDEQEDKKPQRVIKTYRFRVLSEGDLKFECYRGDEKQFLDKVILRVKSK